MEFLLNLDKKLFYFINGSLASPPLDAVMPVLSKGGAFQWILASLFVLAFVFGKRKERTVIILAALTVVFADLFANAIKYLVGRVRPCNALEGVRLLLGCAKSYSFPSSHAANMWAAAVLLSYHYRKLAPAFITLAFLVAFSRVYNGVHYPLDIIFGALLGTGVAAFMLFLQKTYGRAVNDRLEKLLPGKCSSQEKTS